MLNLCQSIWKWTEESRFDFLIVTPLLWKWYERWTECSFLKKKLCLLLKKKNLNPVLQYICCTNSSTSVYLIASLNNFCTLLKWQKLFQKLSSAWSFAPNHVLPTCSTFWSIESNVSQDRLHWEQRFVVGDQYFFYFSQVSIFIKIMCFRVLLHSLYNDL